ncbi:MAG: hypothetical protein LBD59_06825 [Prevotellaceae bacterium]|jgi:hypothetical protein|nr:hypothetical protein [Prevotellaceae bacterium]
MIQDNKSEGKCLFCGKIFARTGISRHLKIELEKLTADKPAGQSFLVKVETDPRWGKTPYFLSLWVDGDATMKDIDTFLRKIWLECCGHLSRFLLPSANKGDAMNLNSLLKTFTQPHIKTGKHGEIAMNRKVNTVFYPDLKLDYQYDFGSTTELQLTVIDEYPVKADKKVVLLSRNEPPKMLCNRCNKAPATQYCTGCVQDGEGLLCNKCAKKHENEDECENFPECAISPVINSPRMGVCGYEGGTIDIERD